MSSRPKVRDERSQLCCDWQWMQPIRRKRDTTGEPTGIIKANRNERGVGEILSTIYLYLKRAYIR